MWRVAFAVKALLTLLLLFWLASKVRFSELLSDLSRADLSLLAWGTLALAIQPIIGALRWQLILRRLELRMPAAAVVTWTYAAVLFNQVLPATIGGDGLRIWLAQRFSARPLGSIVNSVVLDRVAMALALALLVAASAPWFSSVTPAERLSQLVGLLLAGSVAGLLFLLLADRLSVRCQGWRLGRWAASLSSDSRRLLLNRMTGPAILALSLLSIVNIVASIALFAQAFGATAGFWPVVRLLPPVIAISMLPISIGGWGTREVAMVAALGTLSVDAETAVLASVWTGLAGVVTTLPGAFIQFSRYSAPDLSSAMANRKFVA